MSVQKQTFRDFEVIIVDNKSTDNTIKEINRFFSSKDYRKNPFEYIFNQNKEPLKGVKNWNEPIKLAKGKYIAVLEGDDQFVSAHLEEAHHILTKHKYIGVHSVCNQFSKFKKKCGLIKPKTFFQDVYTLKAVSPPSQTIFIREYKGKPYFYNVDDYIYCPEIELYLRISDDGLKAYHNNKRNVIRDIGSAKSLYIYFRDKLKIINKYRNHRWINKKIYIKTLISQINYAFRYLGGVQKRKWTRKKCSIDLDGVLNYYPQCWVDFINMETGLNFKDKDEAKAKLSVKKYDYLKDKYRKSDYKANLKVRKEGLNFVEYLKRKGYFIIIATSRPFERYPLMYDMTKKWLDKNNVPYDKLERKENIKKYQLDFHIDDEIDDANNINNLGYKVFLFEKDIEEIKKVIK